MIVLNDINKNARGGTELMQERLFSSFPKDLMDKFQIIPSRVREIEPDKKKILWLHDLPQDPEALHTAEPESLKRFDKLVAVSNWQAQLFNLVNGVPYDKMTVIRNGIEPIQMGPKQYDETVRIIYHTTPHRGLELLVPVFKKLCELHDNIHLDVYSSFNLYGWKDADVPYEVLFDECRNHPNITYHGAVSNQEIRQALVQSHIFAYPSIWQETSCLSVIEAMSAKNLVVCPNFAALPETCANFAMMYPYNEDKNTHARQFAHTLNNAINSVKANEAGLTSYLDFQKQYFDYFYGWEGRKAEWAGLFNMLLEQI
ncbi:RfaG Glycosyltransferase [uncultured Caudovirales phage]|uniref:RfaG Glycosyltransferase n=1 Tax=uncultured Caudovirales phage TaxID=2100421 RepID=A0A6J7WTK1_9CAUD|nr:RfaG Glycosyltransferase [uncultured Caudovirales phage]